MKPRFLWRFVILCVLLMIVLPHLAAQQVTFAIPKLVVNTSFLNIRTGPGVQFSVLVTVVGGTELPVLGVANDNVWYQVNTSEGVGWVNIEFTLARGEFSRVPLVQAPKLGDPIVGSPSAGQGGGGNVATANTQRTTGVTFKGGDIYQNPGTDQLKIISGASAQPDIVLPLLGQTTLGGVQWYQVNIPPFGVGWTTSIVLRPLACGNDAVGVTIADVQISFDGIAVRDSYVVPKDSEFYLRGVYFGESYIVEDANQTIGIINVNNIVQRSADVISRCDLIPAGTGGTLVSQSLGQGGGGEDTGFTAPVVAVAPSGNVVIVNTGNLNVRSGPSAAFSSIAVVAGGTSLGVVGRASDDVWMLVQGSFGRGWINNEFVLFRGVYSAVPVLSPEEYPLILATAVASLGQGGGGDVSTISAGATNSTSRGSTGVTFTGGDIYANPGTDQLKIISAASAQPDVILPLLNQTTLGGVQWYQVNIPPFGVGWTTSIVLRPLACGTDVVAITKNDVQIRFDGIAIRDAYVVAKGSEFYLRGLYFTAQLIVEDVNGTRGIIAADQLETRSTSVISRCDLIPNGALAAAATSQGTALALEAPVTASTGNVAIVNTGNLNIRSGPLASFGAIATVPGGTQLTVLARSKDNVWFFVEGTFGRGWVNNTLVLFRGVYDSIPVIN